jgi:hypothetical protein
LKNLHYNRSQNNSNQSINPYLILHQTNHSKKNKRIIHHPYLKIRKTDFYRFLRIVVAVFVHEVHPDENSSEFEISEVRFEEIPDNNLK